MRSRIGVKIKYGWVYVVSAAARAAGMVVHVCTCCVGAYRSGVVVVEALTYEHEGQELKHRKQTGTCIRTSSLDTRIGRETEEVNSSTSTIIQN
jgi:hypothetical protein